MHQEPEHSALSVIKSFVLLDARWSLAEAIHLVDEKPDVRFVIVRRKEGDATYWYSYAPREFLLKARQSSAPTENSLTKALNLHEFQSSPTCQAKSAAIGNQVAGTIVLDVKGRPVGVIGPGRRPKNVVEYDKGEIKKSTPSPESDRYSGEPVRPPQSGGGGRWESADGDNNILGGEEDGSSEDNVVGAVEDADLGWSDFGLIKPNASREAASEADASAGDTLELPNVGRPSTPETDAATTHERPFAAWPKLEVPVSVAPHQEFWLTIGFSRQMRPNVVGGPVVIVGAPDQFDLKIQVVGVGFDAPNGWTHELRVIRDDPWRAGLQVKLVAQPSDKPVEVRTLAVQFYYESNLCGHAQCSIVVARYDAPAQERAAALTTPPRTESVPLSVKPGRPPPDLTVTVRLDTGRGRRELFVWTFASPHPINVPQTPAITELESDAGAIVDQLFADLVKLSNDPTGALQMRGIARQIRDRVPAEFWNVLREVASAVAGQDRVPDVLFVTEETRMPWELAWMPEPLVDVTRPNHLGAQVNLGRWILGATRPPLPPEYNVPWRNMVVVVGKYPQSTGLALPDAIEEAKSLTGRSPGQFTQIDMSGPDLVPVLEGSSPKNGAEIVHFACHGKAKSGGAAYSSLTMQNGLPFTSTTLQGSEIGEKCEPFLFLNACEVGRAGVALGQTAGFAGAALCEGFRGFVGPLWEIDSKVAREIAIEFYDRTLGKGEAVAAVLRDIRSRFTYGPSSAAPSPDTYLAYVFYGHPALRLVHQP